MRTPRRLLALAAGLALLPLAGPARAQAPAALENFREVFIALDANGDTVLDREEVPEKGRAAFDRLLKRGDSNEDGKLDVAELQALGQRVRRALGDPAAMAERLRAADSDGDGKVSRAEFPGQPAMFDRLDADGDGFVTKAEIRAMRPAAGAGPLAGAPPAAMARRLAGMDRDGDGKITREEFTGRPAAFDRLDTNKDGVLSPDDRRVPDADAKPEPSANPDSGKP